MKYKILLLTSLLLALQIISYGQNREMATYIDSMFTDGVEQGMIPGGITALVSPQKILMLKGYGLSDVDAEIPVTIDSTLFQLGSIGKIFTSIAVLQNVEKGKIVLNADISNHLKKINPEHFYPHSITPFHLLTHTGGLNEHNIGYLERNNRQVKSLEAYFKQHSPTLFQGPGKNINYSNVGYGLAGYLVESVSGYTFSNYIQEHIFEPGLMKNSTYYLPDDYRNRKNYAKGYEVRKEFNEVISFPRSLIPAGSILSTGQDISYFLRSLLAKDHFIQEESYSWIYEQQFTNHPMLPGITFGMEEQFVNGHRFLAKGGSVPGFISFILIIPEKKLGLFVSINTETDNFAQTFLNEFYDRFFPKEKSEQYPINPIKYSTLDGTYRNMRASHNTMSDLFELLIDHKKVQKLDQSTLGIVQNDRFVKFKALQDTVFINVNDSDQKLVFARKEGEFQYLYGSANIAGLQVPSSYKKVPLIYAPDTINEIYPFILTVIPLYLIVGLVLPIIWFFKKEDKEKAVKFSALPRLAHIIGITFAVAFTIDINWFFIPLIGLIQNGEILFGLPDYLIKFQYLHWFITLMSSILLGYTVFLWSTKKGKLFFRVLYSFYLCSALFYTLMLFKWHFLILSQ